MWNDANWGHITAIPTKPISQYNDPNQGFYDTVVALRKTIDPTYQPIKFEEYQQQINMPTVVYNQTAGKIYNITHIDKADFS